MTNYGVLNFSKTSLQLIQYKLLFPNQLKLKVNDTHKRDEKLTTEFEALKDEDVMNKAHVDTKLSKMKGHLSLIEKGHNEHKLRNNKEARQLL